MPGIFISYRRSDNPDAVGRIYDRLVSEFGKARVFKDVDSIPLGQDFRGHLNDIVGGCAAVLAIIGPKWTDIRNEAGQKRLEDPDDFVRIELEAALARSVPVVPVLVGHAPMPPADCRVRQGARVQGCGLDSAGAGFSRAPERHRRRLRGGAGDHRSQVDGYPQRGRQKRLEDPDDFVRIELEAALARSVPVVPVLVGHAPMPGTSQLPSTLSSLAFRQSIEVRPDPDFHNDATRLVVALQAQSSIRMRRRWSRRQRSRRRSCVTVAGYARCDGHTGGGGICDSGDETPSRSVAAGVRVPKSSRRPSPTRHLRPVPRMAGQSCTRRRTVTRDGYGCEVCPFDGATAAGY